ncbi:GNAT family N-acetyltransferase [Pseudonocardiaceae bacterium YIM PH 21723]|nr:GNAT family N-acetyltransferase [Pseudonocardiaceae bacterium YIM PH 21723]
MIDVSPLVEADRADWERLFQSYLGFYGRTGSPELFDAKWPIFLTGKDMLARIARVDGQVAGFTHFFSHPNASGPDDCYLQDLYTDPEVRGKGVGRALIQAVADWAAEQGCGRVYWHTQQTNAVAQVLYNKVAVNDFRLRYVIDL